MNNRGFEFETAARAGNRLSLLALARFPRSVRQRKGVTLLLVILILAAILSISIGIFDVTFGEIRISGEVGDSFLALYAADQGIEKTLYDDRVANTLCSGNGSCAYGPVKLPAFPNGSCATVRLSRTGGGDTTVTATGEYRCSSPVAAVKQALLTTYKKTSGGGGGPAPVAQWKMNETANGTCPSGKDVCDSIGTNHGTANGASIVSGGGMLGSNARSFNGGSDFITVGDTSSFKFLHGALDQANFKFTISTWMKLSNPNPNALYGLVTTSGASSGVVGAALFYEDRAAVRRRSLSIFISNGVAGQWVCDNSICISNANAYPNDSNWHHVVATFDRALSSGDAKFYIDGVLAGQGNEGPNEPSAGNSTYPLHIGSTGNEAFFFPGSLDEASIYSAALTVTQVCDLYKSASGRTSCP